MRNTATPAAAPAPLTVRVLVTEHRYIALAAPHLTRAARRSLEFIVANHDAVLVPTSVRGKRWNDVVRAYSPGDVNPWEFIEDLRRAGFNVVEA